MKTNKPRKEKDEDLHFDFKAIAKAKPLTREEEVAIGLPSPEELADKMPSTKVNLAIDDHVVSYFKGEAQRLGTSYQRMIRNLLKAYVAQRAVKR